MGFNSAFKGLILFFVNKAKSPLSPISVPCALCICLQFLHLLPEANVNDKTKYAMYIEGGPKVGIQYIYI